MTSGDADIPELRRKANLLRERLDWSINDVGVKRARNR
jgi:hypothetical protein